MSFSTGSPPDPQSSTTATPQVLPVPIGPLRNSSTPAREEQPRPSFWRRIKMRKRSADAIGPGNAEEANAKLATLGKQLDLLDANLRAQFESLKGRLEEVWESEEQLSHLADIQEKLDRLARNQSNLSQSVAGLRRTLAWLAVLAVVAVGGAGVALKLVF